MTIPRAVRCREWMQERYITFPALAKQLGMKSEAGPRMLIARETIPVERYNQLRALGFPEDILPCHEFKKGLYALTNNFPM